MTGKRVFFYVQYLHGVGHLVRATMIAKALHAKGLDVDLVTGGVPVPGLGTGQINIHQLAPIKCRDGDFSDLVDKNGQPLDDTFRDTRRDSLLGLFKERQPDALVIEAFPFGRRQMRFELLPLLEAAGACSPKPLIVCSVRDILQVSGKPGRAEVTVDHINRHFDHVLVHGDPEFAPLEDTFPLVDEIKSRIAYTGLVVGSGGGVQEARGDAGGEILVSAGGGATRGEVLLEAAIKARPLTRAATQTWRLLAGPNIPAVERTRLEGLVPEGVILEDNRPDFGALLANCALSISQAGYNTATDILRCGCRSVLVPYTERDQTEQLHRARAMERIGVAELVEDLTPEHLARAVDTALGKPLPRPARIDMSGAETSAKLIAEWLG